MTNLSQVVEPHAAGLASRLNWLRAGVLGANDGIVSVAALVVGVAAATTDATIPGLVPDVAAALRDRLAQRGEQRSTGL